MERSTVSWRTIEGVFRCKRTKTIKQCTKQVHGDRVVIVDVSKYCRKDRIESGRQKYSMDTTAVNRDLLAALGIPKENIFLSGVCTMCGHKEYHSYRGDHHVTGRNGSMICLK